IGDRTPLRRRVRIARDVAAAVLVEPLTESGQHDVPHALEAIETAHRLGRRLEQPPGDVVLGRGRRSEDDETGRRDRGSTKSSSMKHGFPLSPVTPRAAGPSSTADRSLLLEAENA